MKRQNDRQPSLFDWSPPPKILTFPQARRIGPARRTAQNLLALEDKEAKACAYRRRIHNDLVRMLVERQISEITAAAQADEFMNVVDVELARLRTMARLGMINSPSEGGGR